MTLTKTVLQIEPKYLQYEDLKAFAYIEKRWEQDGKPVERWQLINFLERMLRELKEQGPGYPRVLLLRKKELQRKEYTIPQIDAEAPQAEACPLCAGGGWTVAIGVKDCAGVPCSCPAGKPHREQLEKWGMKL